MTPARPLPPCWCGMSGCNGLCPRHTGDSTLSLPLDSNVLTSAIAGQWQDSNAYHIFLMPNGQRVTLE